MSRQPVSATSSRLEHRPTAWLRSESPLCSWVSSASQFPAEARPYREHLTALSPTARRRPGP